MIVFERVKIYFGIFHSYSFGYIFLSSFFALLKWNEMNVKSNRIWAEPREFCSRRVELESLNSVSRKFSIQIYSKWIFEFESLNSLSKKNFIPTYCIDLSHVREALKHRNVEQNFLFKKKYVKNVFFNLPKIFFFRKCVPNISTQNPLQTKYIQTLTRQ